MKLQPKGYQSYELIESIDLSVPAIRMVVVEGFYDAYAKGEDEGRGGVTVYPVLNVQARVVRRFVRRKIEGQPIRAYVSSQELQGDGWKDEGQDVAYDFMVIDSSYGFCSSEMFNAVNAHCEPLACPWPPEEDDAKLADVKARVLAKAKEKATASAS